MEAAVSSQLDSIPNTNIDFPLINYIDIADFIILLPIIL